MSEHFKNFGTGVAALTVVALICGAGYLWGLYIILGLAGAALLGSTYMLGKTLRAGQRRKASE